MAAFDYTDFYILDSTNPRYGPLEIIEDESDEGEMFEFEKKEKTDAVWIYFYKYSWL